MEKSSKNAVKVEASVDAATGHDPLKRKRKGEKVIGKKLVEDFSPTEAEILLNTPYSQREQSGVGGSKTIYVENIPGYVEEYHVLFFFESAGKIVYLNLPTGDYPNCQGFAYVEFATAREAEEALKLNGEKLEISKVKIRLLKDSGDSDSQSENTAVINGFNKHGGEDLIRRALLEHFGSCGEITRVCIPKNRKGGVKGKAYLEFTNSDSLKKALELSGSELEDKTLYVYDAKRGGKVTKL